MYRKLHSPLMVFILLLYACTPHKPNVNQVQATVTQTRVTTVVNPSTSTPMATPTSLSATSTPTTPSVDIGAYTASVDHLMSADYPDFTGAILVAQRGIILVSKGYGLADRENNIPNTPQTKFAIGSITKSFTAMAIMILKERGLLDVKDPICKYISDCPSAWKDITLENLLTHTSGIYNYTDLDADLLHVDICKEHSPEEIISYIRDFPLDFTPGLIYRYSNSNYFLLGMVIEKISGDSYENFIQKNILQPLGMDETGYDRSNASIKNHAIGYTLDDAKKNIIKAPCWDVSIKFAAGGLYSTVGDLYKWDQAMYSNPLVSQDTISDILTPKVSMDADNHYAYGWVISQQFGHRYIWHNGAVYDGFVAQLARYPDDQVTIVVLSNLNTIDPTMISYQLASLLFGWK